MKKVTILLLFIFLMLSFISCDYRAPQTGTLHGGQILNDEVMSEIKSSIFESDSFEIPSQTESQANDDSNVEEEIIVYWTKNGTVWHLNPDCRHLKKSTEILSGTVSEAIKNKKEKACSECGVETETTTEEVTETISEEITESTEPENDSDTQTDETVESTEETITIYYWTAGGSVWHSDKECWRIKGKDILSGTLQEAMDADKGKGCSNCCKE